MILDLWRTAHKVPVNTALNSPVHRNSFKLVQAKLPIIKILGSVKLHIGDYVEETVHKLNLYLIWEKIINFNVEN